MGSLTIDHIDRLAPIDLEGCNRSASLQTRRDRKYIVDDTSLHHVLASLPADARVLEIEGRRWAGYRSMYLDTPERDAFRLAATRRPRRFKVRVRTYVDSGLTMVEVKTKNRRGRTVKHRLEIRSVDIRTIRGFARRFDVVAAYADDLEPTLITDYERATVVLADAGVRLTIDRRYRCTDPRGTSTGLHGDFIVETKTDGPPSVADRLLWGRGHRPVKISKYATGLAALDAALPANRWHRVLRDHFDPRPTLEPGASNRPACSPLEGAAA